MKIVLDNGNEITVERDTLRRILNAARFHLQRLKEDEDFALPKSDEAALNLILDIQSKDTRLI